MSFIAKLGNELVVNDTIGDLELAADLGAAMYFKSHILGVG